MHQRTLWHLLTLASGNLPIGSYAHSLGFETLIDQGAITDEASALGHLIDCLDALLGFELPWLVAFLASLEANNADVTGVLSEIFWVNRDTQEFIQETQETQNAFANWCGEVLGLGVDRKKARYGFLPLFCRLGQHLGLSSCDLGNVYVFSQLENLTLGVVKTLPLGQMAGARILHQLGAHYEANAAWEVWETQADALLQSTAHMQCDATCVMHALNLTTSLPNAAQLSVLHEGLYSRLFRS